MVSITKAGKEHYQLLTAIGKQSFIESHGHSANEKDIKSYVNEKFTDEISRMELIDTNNIYHIIYLDNQQAGYSKIIFNTPHPEIPVQNITKLERIYLLKKFYDLKLGVELFQFNIDLSKQNNQAGMWLYVWKENERAINFYIKNGFVIAGSYDFKISETHSNPNHLMCLKY